MQILLESILIAILATPLGMPWLAIPFALLRSLVGRVEANVAEDMAAAPGDHGVLVEALIGVGFIGTAGALLLFALMGWGMGL